MLSIFKLDIFVFYGMCSVEKYCLHILHLDTQEAVSLLYNITFDWSLQDLYFKKELKYILSSTEDKLACQFKCSCSIKKLH